MELPDAVATITWRQLTTADFPLLARWLACPHVHRWWHHDSSAEAVERDFGPAARGEEAAEDLLVFLGERPLGLMQLARLSAYPDYLAEIRSVVAVPAESMTLDYFLAAPGDLGQGLGTAMISAFVEAIFVEYGDIESIVVAVCAANVGSWRALEKAGLQRVGSGPMEPDNPVDDPMHHVYRLDRAVVAQ